MNFGTDTMYFDSSRYYLGFLFLYWMMGSSDATEVESDDEEEEDVDSWGSDQLFTPVKDYTVSVKGFVVVIVGVVMTPMMHILLFWLFRLRVCLHETLCRPQVGGYCWKGSLQASQQ